MTDYVVGRCFNCSESHMFTSPQSRDKWLSTHFLPEPTDRFSQDREAAGL